MNLDRSNAEWRSALRSRMVVAGLAILAVLVAVALLAPLLAPYDPKDLSGASLERPSWQHWLGTDDVGHDILSQLIYGVRTSLVVAVGSASLALFVGVLFGVTPALVGGAVDTVVTRLAVMFLAVPVFPLLILVAAFLGRQSSAAIFAVGLIAWAPMSRVLRSQILTLRQRGFVAAARGFGGGPLYVLRRHLLPGIAPLLVVGFVQWAGIAIGLEAGLAFLGLGDPTGVSWGLMLNRALETQGIYFSAQWTWWVLPPGLAITLAVLGFTFVGVGLEPRFNPRWLRAA